MGVDVTLFTSQARVEFLNGCVAAQQMPMPAPYAQFTTELPSTTKVDTHTFLSALPQLREFKGVRGATTLMDSTYTTVNKRHRIGPVEVALDTLEDEQAEGYKRQIKSMPEQAKADMGHLALAHLAAGTSKLCFDGSAFFANSHNFGSGDNLDTANSAGSSDGATHYIIALVTRNPAVKPLLVTNRTPLSGLDTDADTPQARELTRAKYWADCRFGLGYGFWWDAYHLTITDTPTVADCYTHLEQIINGLRTFTLPKGDDEDTARYAHEGWMPAKDNFVLLCNMKLGAILDRAISVATFTNGAGAAQDNVYKDKATVLPTSALGA